MATAVSQDELLARLQARVAELGLTLASDEGPGLACEVESIRSRWLLGSRKVQYRMACQLVEPARTVHFLEVVVESSWGLLPPTFTVERTTLRGWRRSGTRVDRSAAGGGTVDYGRVREALEDVVRQAGWQFIFEAGRLP